MRRNAVLYMFAVVVALAVGCSREEKNTRPEVSLVSSPLSTPALQSILASPLPTPDSPLGFPQPPAGLGTVGGMLVLEVDSTPIAEATIYLGTVDRIESEPAMARLNTQTAPQAFTDAAGRFVFTDVPPGHYALIYETPLDTFLARYPNGEDIVFEVESDEIVDLGTIQTPLLDR
jgi:hypothetical protein